MEPYRIRTARTQSYPITTLTVIDGFLVIHCVGEWNESKAKERVIALYNKMMEERCQNT